MSTPKYFLAKYVPDIMRHEPRNIGVILWSEAGVEARFLAEREDKPEIDGRSIPAFVTSPSAYRQWIDYWRRQLEQNEIKDFRQTITASRTSDQFLEVLKLSNKGNFILEEGGIITEPVPAENLSAVTEELFTSLVEDSSLEITSEATLFETCEDLIRETDLNKSPYFKTTFSVECEVNGIPDKCTFNYAFQNGHLGRLYQRVPLPKKRKENVIKNVHETAWMFEQVIRSQRISRDDTAALIYATPQQQADPDTSKVLKVLDSITRVVNLQEDKSQIVSEFMSLASYKA